MDETLDIGTDTGTPLVKDYAVPFAFTGTIDHVTIDLKDQPQQKISQAEDVGID